MLPDFRPRNNHNEGRPESALHIRCSFRPVYLAFSLLKPR
jgi:hypothetical protein